MTPEPQSLSLVKGILERLRRRKIELLCSSDVYRLPCRRITRLPLGSVLHLELAEARDRRLSSRGCRCGDCRKHRLDDGLPLNLSEAVGFAMFSAISFVVVIVPPIVDASTWQAEELLSSGGTKAVAAHCGFPQVHCRAKDRWSVRELSIRQPHTSASRKPGHGGHQPLVVISRRDLSQPLRHRIDRHRPRTFSHIRLQRSVEAWKGESSP